MVTVVDPPGSQSLLITRLSACETDERLTEGKKKEYKQH